MRRRPRMAVMMMVPMMGMPPMPPVLPEKGCPHENRQSDHDQRSGINHHLAYR